MIHFAKTMPATVQVVRTVVLLERGIPAVEADCPNGDTICEAPDRYADILGIDEVVRRDGITEHDVSARAVTVRHGERLDRRARGDDADGQATAIRPFGRLDGRAVGECSELSTPCVRRHGRCKRCHDERAQRHGSRRKPSRHRGYPRSPWALIRREARCFAWRLATSRFQQTTPKTDLPASQVRTVSPLSVTLRASVGSIQPERAVQNLAEFVSTRVGGSPGATILLGLIVLASLAGLLVSPALIERSLFRPFWLLPRRQYSTLVTSGFVHADLGHLIFNAVTFWAFAFALERTIGTPRFLVLYFIGLFASDLGTYFTHRRDPDFRTLGASGAILAVLFASIIYFPPQAILVLPIPVPIPAPLFAVGYLAYSYFASRRARGRINHDAHLAGALAGLAFVAVTDMDACTRALRTLLG